jgi:hypothetical protein
MGQGTLTAGDRRKRESSSVATGPELSAAGDFAVAAGQALGAETPLARLAAMRRTRGLLDRLEVEAVEDARGTYPFATLEQLGRALGMSTSAVHRRYGGHR